MTPKELGWRRTLEKAIFLLDICAKSNSNISPQYACCIRDMLLEAWPEDRAEARGLCWLDQHYAALQEVKMLGSILNSQEQHTWTWIE